VSKGKPLFESQDYFSNYNSENEAIFLNVDRSWVLAGEYEFISKKDIILVCNASRKNVNVWHCANDFTKISL
jgi:hypothetical protein